jgi:hypothetical protein
MSACEYSDILLKSFETKKNKEAAFAFAVKNVGVPAEIYQLMHLLQTMLHHCLKALSNVITR